MSSHWPARPRALRPSRLLALAVLIFAALAPLLQGAAPPQPLPTQRVDLKVLVVGNTTAPWAAALQREGVPFDTRASGAINDGVLANYGANRAFYQAVIVTTGVPLPAGAQNALVRFESTFGIRQISEIGDSFNIGAHGIASIATSGPQAYGDQSGQVGQLTPLGNQIFPYLNGPVQIEGPGAFGYGGAPATVPPGAFQPLLNSPTPGYVFMGIYTDPVNLTQDMVMTVSSNQFQLHNTLLRHGMLSWVTRGVYLGTQRNYFKMDIDDILLPDSLWDPVANTTPGDASAPTCGQINLPACIEARMTPNDLAGAVAWEQANGVTFDFLFNGQGYQDAIDANALLVPPVAGDPLADDPVNGLFANKASFRWMNHTFTHLQLDLASTPAVTGEINNNLAFGQNHQLPGLNAQEIVTGEHSGLGSYLGVLPTGLCGNPAGTAPCPLNNNVATAFNNTGIRWAGDDASAKPAQRLIGANTLTVPRYPSNVYYNVETRERQLDEYNSLYTNASVVGADGHCVASAVTTCRNSQALWLTNSANGDLSYVNSEVGIMFGHLMGNDPRPHYAHQTNLILDANGLGILYKHPGAAGDPGVLDVLLARYKTYFNEPLIQPTLAESGQLLQKQAGWAANVAAGRASGYLLDGQVHVVATQGMDVPLTGVGVGDVYGGQRSGWTTVGAGDTAFTPVDPANTTPPNISGATAEGSTLTATTGGWTGTSVPPLNPINLNYQWQRCNGPICVNITGIIDNNYKIGAIDKGYSIRVVQMAGNLVSSVSQAASNTILVPGPKPPPGTPPTAAGAGNNPASAITVLRLTNVTVSPRTFRAQRTVKVKGKRKIVGGTTISWRLDVVAKVNIVIQKKKGKKWVTMGTIQRDSKAGLTRYRFTGRLTNNKLIKPGAYRFSISAARPPKLKTPAKAIAFTFLKG